MYKLNWGFVNCIIASAIFWLILFLFICGCATKLVWSDDVFVVSSSWLSWGETDDLILDVNDTMLSAGSSKYHPDANAVGEIAGGIIERILP